MMPKRYGRYLGQLEYWVAVNLYAFADRILQHALHRSNLTDATDDNESLPKTHSTPPAHWLNMVRRRAPAFYRQVKMRHEQTASSRERRNSVERSTADLDDSDASTVAGTAPPATPGMRHNSQAQDNSRSGTRQTGTLKADDGRGTRPVLSYAERVPQQRRVAAPPQSKEGTHAAEPEVKHGRDTRPEALSHDPAGLLVTFMNEVSSSKSNLKVLEPRKIAAGIQPEFSDADLLYGDDSVPPPNEQAFGLQRRKATSEDLSAMQTEPDSKVGAAPQAGAGQACIHPAVPNRHRNNESVSDSRHTKTHGTRLAAKHCVQAESVAHPFQQSVDPQIRQVGCIAPNEQALDAISGWPALPNEVDGNEDSANDWWASLPEDIWSAREHVQPEMRPSVWSDH